MENRTFCDIYMEQTKCLVVYHVQWKVKQVNHGKNWGWEPPLTMYPKGQGEIPQHLWDWSNGGTGAWPLFSGKEENMKRSVTRDGSM